MEPLFSNGVAEISVPSKEAVSEQDGCEEGAMVGETDGVLDGMEVVGAAEGEALGNTLGTLVGMKLGFTLGRGVGLTLGASVGLRLITSVARTLSALPSKPNLVRSAESPDEPSLPEIAFRISTAMSRFLSSPFK